MTKRYTDLAGDGGSDILGQVRAQAQERARVVHQLKLDEPTEKLDRASVQNPGRDDLGGLVAGDARDDE